ncbi:MAG: extracellular solute-binding protein [Bacteroidales bacterium]|nr:extracellular solute-binding protein [Bacteroidales bacterium]
MKKIIFSIGVVSIMLLIIVCDRNSKNKLLNQEQALKTGSLVIYTPHHRELLDPIVTEFEKQTGIKVEVGMDSTKELLDKVAIGVDNPKCDIYWGGSLSFIAPLSKCFKKFISDNEAYVIDAFKNRDSTRTIFTNMPSVLLVNTNLLGNNTIEGYQDLLKTTLKGRIAFADPEESSSSFEHLVNMLLAMGKGNPENGWPYVRQLIKQLNGKVLSRSVDVYQGVANGKFIVGLSYEEGAARMVRTGAPVKIVYMKEGVVFRRDGICIIKSAKNINNAKAFVNFCTSREIQTLVASKLNRRSVRKDVFSAKGLEQINTINELYYSHNSEFFFQKDKLISKFKKEMNL